MTLDQVADVVGAVLADPEDGTRTIDAVTIDSRTAAPGALFVALVGDHADGHRFVPDAVARGASGYLQAVDARPLPEPGGLIVDDPADALLGLGAWVRDTVDPLVVAVTGSQGKTTTKDLLRAAVGDHLAVVASPGSFNNELGVPLTCCLLAEGTQLLVTELGSRGIGHIARLTPVVRPDVAVVTAIGASHLELLGDVDTVARAKGELVEALTPAGTAVLNADDPRVVALAARTDARILTYAVEAPADWTARDVMLDAAARPRFTAVGPVGQVVVELPLSGAHNVANALAALAVADLVGVAPEEAAAGLAGAAVAPWRMQLGTTPDGVQVLNDAYNANPASTRAALDALAALRVAGRRWAVLGEMAELGETSETAHVAVGAYAAGLGLERLVAVGNAAAAVAEGAAERGMPADQITTVDGPDAATALLSSELRTGDAVLVKASRSVGLERVAATLIEPEAGP